MSRYIPTLRGCVALLLAAFGVLYFPFLRPALFVVSGRGTVVTEPVTPVVWIMGGVLIVISLIACVEAFRRGSQADKTCACVAALLTMALMFQYFELVVVSRSSPKKVAAADNHTHQHVQRLYETSPPNLTSSGSGRQLCLSYTNFSTTRHPQRITYISRCLV